jgi:hypothetical protein
MQMAEVRARLEQIAQELILEHGLIDLAQRVELLAGETRRRAPIRRASQESIPAADVPYEMREWAIDEALTTDRSYQDIATEIGVNAGRISEWTAGKRT